jgi:hypothetical protein
VTSTYRGEVLFELPLQLHGRVFGARLEADYLRPSDADSTTMARTDRGWVEGGALLRRFGKHLSLGGQVEHQSRVSPVDGRTYDGVRFGLTGDLRF